MAEKEESGKSALNELQQSLDLLCAGQFEKSRIEAILGLELHETQNPYTHFYEAKVVHPLFSAIDLRVPGPRAMTREHLLVLSIRPGLYIPIREVLARYGRGTFGIGPDGGPPNYTYALADGSLSFTSSRPPDDRLESVALRKAGALPPPMDFRSRLSRWWKARLRTLRGSGEPPWQPAIRGLLYPVQYETRLEAGIEHVVATVVDRGAMGYSREDFRKAIGAALASDEMLSQLIPMAVPRPEQDVRFYLRELLRRLEGG